MDVGVLAVFFSDGTGALCCVRGKKASRVGLLSTPAG